MNLVCITARMNSERLPGKVLARVCGRPNLDRVITRFRKCKNVDELIVATSTETSDDEIATYCQQHDVPYFRGEKDDVLKRVLDAARERKADYILRGTCDCPFISWELVDMAFQVIEFYGAEAGRVWGVSTRGIPVYGAAEFPFSMECLEKMHENTQGADREHVAADLERHRLIYNVVYPAPPLSYVQTFYRPYRLELDTPDDLKLVEAVTEAIGDAPLHQTIRWLDAHQEVTRYNAGITEKTGPMQYPAELRAEWTHQQAYSTIECAGDWSWLTSGSPTIPTYAKSLYCAKGTCYLGYVLRGSDKVHRLYLPDGSRLTGRATLTCECGAGREWYADIKNSAPR